MTELLSDPENIKVQLNTRMQAEKAKFPPGRSTSEFDEELAQFAVQEKRIPDAYREPGISPEDLKAQK